LKKINEKGLTNLNPFDIIISSRERKRGNKK